MKVSEYKGYEIEFEDYLGQFTIKGIKGMFDKYKDAKNKIDRVIKAEVQENFPIDVVSDGMKIGEITSYNKVEQEAWFSPKDGSRSKEQIVNWSGNPRFYKANENNLALAEKYKGLSSVIAKLYSEQRNLEKGLTEPINFETSED